MRVSMLLTGACASLVAAQGVLDTINTSFTTIGTALDGLKTSVEALKDGGDTAAATKELTAKSVAVDTAIKDATTKIKGASGTISLSDAIAVPKASSKLVDQTKATIDALIAKKPVIAKANQSGLVKEQLTMQKTDADALANAIVAKLPEGTQTIGKQQAGQISEAIAKGITAYS